MEHTPFGYRYQGDNCSIKLRFKENKFMEAGLNKFGSYRYSKNGFIILDITLSTKSDEYKELSAALRDLQTTK